MITAKIKTSTSTEYHRRINNAVSYILQYLDQPIQLDDVARASHFSSYHFHRIFHALMGETVNDFISRKRMEKAIRMLVYKPDMSVTAVAAAGGFSSGANFSRAFKLYFGISPTGLRNAEVNNSDNNSGKIGKFYRKYGKAFNPQDLYSQFVTQLRVFEPDKLEEMLMNVEVKQQDEKQVVFLSSPKGYELETIFATWDKLIHWANTQGIDDDKQTRFGICYDNPSITPEDKCRYEAAIVVSPEIDVREPYRTSVVPAGHYAIAYFKDDAEKINAFITELCSTWFPDSGYEPDDYPLIFNYLNDSRKDGYVEMNVYFKVKALRLD